MKFIPTRFDDAFLVEPQCHEDERGYFARLWCAQEFARQGLNPRLVQMSVSYSHRRGTLRGMHYQNSPHEEAKLVRCSRGRIFDVIVDLRPDSKTCRKWQGFELSDKNSLALYVPEGFAHGFLTLEENCEVHYQMSESFHADAARGVCWNDPALGIEWPEPVQVISPRDQSWELLSSVDNLSRTR